MRSPLFWRPSIIVVVIIIIIIIIIIFHTVQDTFSVYCVPSSLYIVAYFNVQWLTYLSVSNSHLACSCHADGKCCRSHRIDHLSAGPTYCNGDSHPLIGRIGDPGYRSLTNVCCGQHYYCELPFSDVRILLVSSIIIIICVYCICICVYCIGYVNSLWIIQFIALYAHYLHCKQWILAV